MSHSLAGNGIKTTLHKNDVEKVYQKNIENFRDMCKEYKDKKLIVIVAGQDILKDAQKLANQYGFVSMSEDDKKLSVFCGDTRFY